MRPCARFVAPALSALTLMPAVRAGTPICPDAGKVLSEQKISAIEGGFGGDLDGGDRFGRSVAHIGDLDGDGVSDLAVGASEDDDGGANHGAVWIVFLNPDGTVKSEQKISSAAGGFEGQLDNSDIFGVSVGGLGDLDGDGVPDLAVGAPGDDDGGTDRGAVWIVFLKPDGTVKGEQKISDTAGGFEGLLDDGDQLGIGLGPLGDLDGDGVIDLAITARLDDDGGTSRGAVWIVFLNPDGTTKSEQKISDTSGGFDGMLDDGDQFGVSVAAIDDMNDDGVADVAVGAFLDDDGGTDRGAVWLLFMNSDGTVKDEQKISDTSGGFGGTLDDGDQFGIGVSAVGDLDGDGAVDLAVGAYLDDDGGTDRGAVWLLFMNSDGTVKDEQKISSSAGGFDGQVGNGDNFGTSVAALGDLNAGGPVELAVGAFFDNESAVDDGSVWILSLDDGRVSPACPADVVTDGMIDSSDLNAVLAAFGDTVVEGCKPDTNADGAVDSTDLNAILGSFGSECEV